METIEKLRAEILNKLYLVEEIPSQTREKHNFFGSGQISAYLTVLRLIDQLLLEEGDYTECNKEGGRFKIEH